MRPKAKPVDPIKKRYIPLGKESMIDEIIQKMTDDNMVVMSMNETSRYGKKYTLIKFEPAPEETEEE